MGNLLLETKLFLDMSNEDGVVIIFVGQWDHGILIRRIPGYFVGLGWLVKCHS